MFGRSTDTHGRPSVLVVAHDDATRPKMTISEDSSVLTNQRSCEETGSPGFSVHPLAERGRGVRRRSPVLFFSSCVSPPPVRPAHSRFEFRMEGASFNFKLYDSRLRSLLFGHADQSYRNHRRPITKLLRQTSRFCRYDLFLRALICSASPLCRNSKIFPLDQTRATA